MFWNKQKTLTDHDNIYKKYQRYLSDLLWEGILEKFKGQAMKRICIKNRMILSIESEEDKW